MRIVILPPLYLPPASYFDSIAGADLAVIDTSMAYDKRRKEIHRTVVRGTRGPSFLTVPLASDSRHKGPVEALRISSHGNWWHVHQSTMATLFGNTPYFHLVKTDFFSLIDKSAVGTALTNLNISLLLRVCKLLGITTPLSVTLDPRYTRDSGTEIVDYRERDFYADGSVSVVEDIFKQGIV